MNGFLRTLKIHGKKFHISLDLTEVTLITPEAIAALAATISSSSLPNTNVRGNLPTDPSAKQILLQSGFFEHVSSIAPLPGGQYGKIKERNSKLVEATTAKLLIDCGTLQAFHATKYTHSTRAAYKTLIELMVNTHNHAGGKRPELETWWATAFGDVNRKRVCYSFLDTGVGIFRSVRVHLLKHLFRRIGVYENREILQDILKGHVASRTGLAYRGKGLPTIYAKAVSGDLKSLFIIANDVWADVSKGVYLTMKIPFDGTLLYWESEE